MPGAGCRAAANEIKDTAITPEKICTVSQERSCTPQELPDAYEKEAGGPPWLRFLRSTYPVFFYV